MCPVGLVRATRQKGLLPGGSIATALGGSAIACCTIASEVVGRGGDIRMVDIDHATECLSKIWNSFGPRVYPWRNIGKRSGVGMEAPQQAELVLSVED